MRDPICCAGWFWCMSPGLSRREGGAEPFAEATSVSRELMALEMIVSEGGSKVASKEAPAAAAWLEAGVESVMSNARMACATVVPEGAS